MEFSDDIQIRREKWIEICTNMPSIGLDIPEKIAFKVSNVEESRKFMAKLRQNYRPLSVNLRLSTK